MHSALGCAPYDRESRRLSSSRLGHCVRACRIFSQIQKTPISLRNSSPNGGIGIRRKYSAGRREENRHSRVGFKSESLRNSVWASDLTFSNGEVGNGREMAIVVGISPRGILIIQQFPDHSSQVSRHNLGDTLGRYGRESAVVREF